MKTLILTVVILFALAVSSFAQTPSYTMLWEHTEAPAVVNAFTFTLKTGTAAAFAVIPTCTANGTGSRCSLPLVTTGTTYVLSAYNGYGTSSATHTGVPPSGPAVITVTVTITIP